MNNRINIYYSEWLALLPLALFIVGAMYLGLNGSPDEKGFWPIITAALALALLISKDKDAFAKYVISGMASNLVMIMVAAWLFSSIIGVFLSETGVVSALVGYYKSFGLGGGGFVFGVFIVTAIIGTSTGTAVGTVLMVTPVLFQAGINIGCDEYYLVGAILGGAAFGDDFSPLSDTTIASASTQNVNIGRSVKSRIKYVLSAAIPASIIFILFGGNHNEVAMPLENESSLLPLVMLVAPATIVYLCLKGRHILYALLAGIIVSLAISLGLDLVQFNQVFSLDPDEFSAKSIIIDGMDKGVGISVFSILLMGLVSFVMMSGVIEKLLSMLLGKISSLQIAELIIVFLTIFINALLAHNTITIIAVGDIVRDISKKYQINSYRASNLMDISANTVMHMFPYMITVVLVASAANGILKDGRQIDLIAAGFHNFHSIFLLVVAIVVSLTGIWLKSDERYLVQEKEV